ncbi:putative pentatricopeptide repeat-containing protein At1g69350, mitochondrial [Cannabis sativa]|uniref:Pentatricopeptide repeat-containing protein n=1 Tax=Cannabis sativa TaxID=3483 RepID=A0A803PGZ8_CANSA|nr:putative pentatricopeptide repeat-containing protein At1g69350, mitochondrial [Cannabis sativa]
MSLYMPLFRSCTTIRTLVQLHAHLFVSGLHKDPQASTKLIQSYAQMGSLQSSKQVFQTFPNPDFFMWGVLIKCYVWNHLFKEAIALYHKMLYLRIHVNRFIFPSVLRAFSSFGDVDCGGKLHGRAIKCGFDNDGIVQTSLLLMYGDFGCLDNARKVFDAMSVRDLVAWSAMIESCVENGMANEALDLFCWMVFEGVNPDSVTMLSVVDACGDLRSSRLVKSVHGYIVRRNMKTDGSLDSSLITMYGKCGDLHGAEILFRNVTHPTTSSWTAMLSCYNQSGCFYKAIDIFVKMQLMIVEPNSVTMMSVLRSCANLGLLKEGKSIHCFAIRKAVDFDILKPTLLELYADCRRLSDCEKILLTTGEKNIVQWNTLISILARKGLLEEALLVFKQMITEGLMPDSYSLASSLSACGNVGQLHLGHQIHSHILKRSYFDEFVQNSLIDMYCKCGIMDSSYKVFDKLKQKSVVAWNCMICGFSQNGYSYEAISLFDQMYFDRLQMNEVTFLLVIQACSESGYLEKGKWLHHKLITCGMNQDTYIGTALTDMYAKCGDLKTARRVFDSISERSIVSWSVMIAGYGMHGEINEAITLFDQMMESGIKPNDVTFMNVLSACSHAGSVEQGKLYFKMMKNFGIEPNTEHFACMVDLMSRAGDLYGAYGVIKSMPVFVEASIWSSLLNGCRIHQRMDMLNNIQKDISDISSDDPGYYTLLSNIYAEEGNWDEFGKVRSRMKHIGLKKIPGYSTIELENRTYRFGAGDVPHPDIKEICSFLDNFKCLAQGQDFVA